MADAQPTEPSSPGRVIGAVLQGIALGLPLFIALAKLWSEAEGASVFRYQGF